MDGAPSCLVSLQPADFLLLGPWSHPRQTHDSREPLEESQNQVQRGTEAAGTLSWNGTVQALTPLSTTS